MPTEEKKVYRLYALPPTWESIQKAINERFSRATPTPAPGYVLIYTAGEKPDGAQEITEERRALLTVGDMRWLVECGAAILSEEMAKQAPETIARLSERIEALESKLKRAKEEFDARGE